MPRASGGNHKEYAQSDEQHPCGTRRFVGPRLKLIRLVTTIATNPVPTNKSPPGSGVSATCLGSGVIAGSGPASHPPPNTISVAGSAGETVARHVDQYVVSRTSE